MLDERVCHIDALRLCQIAAHDLSSAALFESVPFFAL
jgi:hypothetical protein